MRSAELLLAVCAVAAARPVLAKEIIRTESGVVVDGKAFYKLLGAGFVLPPEMVASSKDAAALQAEAGLSRPSTLPPAGILNAHIGRVQLRLRVKEWVSFDVAWQLALSLASDPIFTQGALGNTVGGIGVGAQRRLFEGAGTLSQGPYHRIEHNLDRLSVKLALPFGDLTVGRQVLSWGTGRVWNPTDVLSPFPPTAIDREVRRGFDAVRLAIAVGEVMQLDILYLPQLVPAENGGVVRFVSNNGGFDWSISAGKYVRDLVFGADLVGDIGPVAVHAEGAYTLELSGLGSGSVTVGEHFFRGVAGAEVRPSEKLLLMLEYSFNGYGSTDPARYAAILSSPRVVRGEIFGAGMHQAALALSLAASDVLSVQASLLMNLCDPSFLLVPSIEYTHGQSLIVRGGAYLPIGVTPDAFVYRMAPPAVSTVTRGLHSEYGSNALGLFAQVGVYIP